MAYYRGDYYRAHRGDFYRGRGDWLSGISNFGSNLAAKVGNLLPQSWTPSGVRTVAGGVGAAAGLGAAALAAGPLVAGGIGAAKSLSGLAGAFMGRGASASAANASAARVMRSLNGGGGRRMNVANPRALRKALRRVAGFGKLARRARRDIGRAATAVGVQRHARGRRFGKRAA